MDLLDQQFIVLSPVGQMAGATARLQGIMDVPCLFQELLVLIVTVEEADLLLRAHQKMVVLRLMGPVAAVAISLLHREVGAGSPAPLVADLARLRNAPSQQVVVDGPPMRIVALHAVPLGIGLVLNFFRIGEGVAERAERLPGAGELELVILRLPLRLVTDPAVVDGGGAMDPAVLPEPSVAAFPGAAFIEVAEGLVPEASVRGDPGKEG